MISTKQAERSIFEALRLAVIVAGYLPDITAAADAEEWKTNRQTLRDSLVFPVNIVDVFGVGSPEGRDEKFIHRIVIDREGSVPGDIGGAPATQFKLISGVEGEAGARYDKQKVPSMSENVTYEITSVTNHITMDRVIRSIIKNTLKGRYYLETVDDNGDKDGNYILLEFVNDIDRTAGDNMVRSLRYVVYDLYDEEALTISADIASMDTVTFQVSPVETSVDLSILEEQGTWDANTNTPALDDGTGTVNHYYAVRVAGTNNLGSGNITWATSDIVYHDGIKWEKLNQ